MAKTLLILFSFLLLFSCDKFDYNVYETRRHKNIPEVKSLYNIKRLQLMPEKDTLHLVLFGDMQRFYDNLSDLIPVVNNLEKVDAVLITGDITDFATALEFEWINEELVKLKAPFLTVIGNHDCLANGRKLYEEIYGPLNYAFTWNNIRFVMHNTNGREFLFNGTVPDINWMQQQINDTSHFNACIFVSHINPDNSDFDPQLETAYSNLIANAKNTLFSAHGHNHSYYLAQPYDDEIWYLNTGSPQHREFSYIKVYPNVTEGKQFDCSPVTY